MEIVLLNKLFHCALLRGVRIVCSMYTGEYQFEPILFSLSLLHSVVDVDIIPFHLFYVVGIKDHRRLMMGF